MGYILTSPLPYAVNLPSSHSSKPCKGRALAERKDHVCTQTSQSCKRMCKFLHNRSSTESCKGHWQWTRKP